MASVVSSVCMLGKDVMAMACTDPPPPAPPLPPPRGGFLVILGLAQRVDLLLLLAVRRTTNVTKVAARRTRRMENMLEVSTSFGSCLVQNLWITTLSGTTTKLELDRCETSGTGISVPKQEELYAEKSAPQQWDVGGLFNSDSRLAAVPRAGDRTEASAVWMKVAWPLLFCASRPETLFLLCISLALWSYFFHTDEVKTIVKSSRDAVKMVKGKVAEMMQNDRLGGLNVLDAEFSKTWEFKNNNVAVYSIQGRRDHMEDRFEVLTDIINKSHPSIFGIFDGHGGEVGRLGVEGGGWRVGGLV
ncbi:unnamed protein product [Tetraodon nigroviridis]|uniref:(spotted green pufferfish) hypothetical protein n=1 Tax=Tetraodon nigroviridis TaxID=99883 RepID=Q4RVB5_TETNG|nr:unnamed protein product [Tetraodon nigroviridis]